MCRAAAAAPAAPPSRSQLLRRAAAAAGGAALALALGQQAAPAWAKPPSAVVSALNENGRTIIKTASGIKYTELGAGSGEEPRVGDLVMCDVVLSLEDGTTVLDTREAGTPIAFQVGITNPLVTAGLDEVVRGMKAGATRLAVVPPALGYGAKATTPRGGSVAVPGNADLYYEIELLRCQGTPLGLACCSEAKYSERGGACIPPETLQQLEARRPRGGQRARLALRHLGP
ncbi:MAG: hypothetical protein J3K34DRAFT_458153 [Monoraphidium minutum]|nr:MAG: hypothetical protein J3K34DRAFT_458153 [Monoraphidium minutum]